MSLPKLSPLNQPCCLRLSRVHEVYALAILDVCTCSCRLLAFKPQIRPQHSSEKSVQFGCFFLWQFGRVQERFLDPMCALVPAVGWLASRKSGPNTRPRNQINLVDFFYGSLGRCRSVFLDPMCALVPAVGWLSWFD